ncbi:Regulator of telomere elongation helicase 1 [Dionaea muscipula]
MPIYKIRGIDVDFPYDAYDCQIDYMEKVVQSLQQRGNALLESPTGTGKTLCLLCATLAWRKSLGPFSSGNSMSTDPTSQSDELKLPVIVYASRTHGQLRQVVQELRRTNYRPKMVVLGSREQLCIHDEVRLLQGKAQTNACRFLRKQRTKRYCKHFKSAGDYLKINPHLGDEPVDIEDLVNIGRSSGPCPYYLARDLHKVVDILFAPYNYLIERGNRDSLSIEWKNSILIFDEAHNLESICADAASFDLPAGLLTACISEAKNCIDISLRRRERENSDDKNSNPDNFAILRALLLKLERRILEVHIESKELGFTRPGPYIYELLADLNITSNTASKLIGIIEEAALLLEEDANVGGESRDMKGMTCRLETMGKILGIIFKDGGTSHAQYYRVHVRESEANGGDSYGGKISRTLSWWCFNPGIAMDDFARRGVGTVILTSGTLSPMDSFAHELKLEFPVRLENPHVISSDQIWAGVLPAGPSGHSFNSSYRNRDSPEYKRDLGNAIVNITRIVPDGLLVFFPSYYLMEQCIACWKDNFHGNPVSSSTIWERICRHKQPVVEPRQSSLFSVAIDDYMSKLKDNSTSGAVFFAVCRGKVSEGLDFTDHAGRAVVITGLPFATRNDPKVRLKREYLDHLVQSQTKGSKTLTGEEWYDQQASRAVNQAVGRVIRHRHDYGALIFCDERFTSSHRQSQVSRWIQPHMKCYSKFGDVVYALTRFFRDAAQRPIVLQPASFLYSGNSCQPNASNPQGNFCSEKSFTQARPNVENCCTLSLSANDVNRGKAFSLLGEFLPANRSSLAVEKQNQNFVLKHAANLFNSGKKLLLSQTLSPCKNSEIMATSNASSSMEGNEEPIPFSCNKRPKILLIDPGCSQHDKISQVAELGVEEMRAGNILPTATAVKQEKCETSVTGNKNSKAMSTSQVNLGSSSTSQNEAKGSAFLLQVKEKLTPMEYKEFVGYMKALKSKELKIGPVLQSIVKLFSTQERLPLLRSFKDYIPGKYLPLYEEHCICASNHKSVGT